MFRLTCISVTRSEGGGRNFIQNAVAHVIPTHIALAHGRALLVSEERERDVVLLPAPEGVGHRVGIDAAARPPTFWHLVGGDWPPALFNRVAGPVGRMAPLVEVARLVKQCFGRVVEGEAGRHAD